MGENVSAVEKLDDLLDRYFQIGVQQGLENRAHDDREGSAQVTYEEIRSFFLTFSRQAEALKRENAELRAFAASFKLTCVESSFYKDCYLHISEPDSVSFRLGNGSQFSKFIAGLEDRRARTLLGGENAGN